MNAGKILNRTTQLEIMALIPRRQVIQTGITSLSFGLSGCSLMNSQPPNTDGEGHHVYFSLVNDSEHTVTLSLSISETNVEGVQVEEIHYLDEQEEFQEGFVIRPGEIVIWLSISGENVRGGSYEDTITIESDVSVETSFDGETVEGSVERQ